MNLEQIIFYGFTIAIAFGISMIVSMVRKETIQNLRDEIKWLRDRLEVEENIEDKIRDLNNAGSILSSRVYKIEEKLND